MDHKSLLHYLPEIKKLLPYKNLNKDHLLSDRFLLDKEGDLKMYYAPHNEYIEREAKIVIVGITPGWTQMKIAYEHFIAQLLLDENLQLACKQAKIKASFAGSMRNNLITMLDQCGLADVLQLKSTALLFTSHRYLLHTTSFIKYPVFYKGKNYTGYTPQVNKSKLLHKYAYGVFPRELAQIKQPALVITLGKIAEQIVSIIQNNNNTHILNFPHPSGVNGHRYKQFNMRKDRFRSIIKQWGERVSI